MPCDMWAAWAWLERGRFVVGRMHVMWRSSDGQQPAGKPVLNWRPGEERYDSNSNSNSASLLRPASAGQLGSQPGRGPLIVRQ